jgi:hypothetical protein
MQVLEVALHAYLHFAGKVKPRSRKKKKQSTQSKVKSKAVQKVKGKKRPGDATGIVSLIDPDHVAALFFLSTFSSPRMVNILRRCCCFPRTQKVAYWLAAQPCPSRGWSLVRCVEIRGSKVLVAQR